MVKKQQTEQIWQHILLQNNALRFDKINPALRPFLIYVGHHKKTPADLRLGLHALICSGTTHFNPELRGDKNRADESYSYASCAPTFTEQKQIKSVLRERLVQGTLLPRVGGSGHRSNVKDSLRALRVGVRRN